MYIPKQYAITDLDAIVDFIKENSFATLITQGDRYPMATHTPVMLTINQTGEKVLRGHISKANPQWKTFEKYPKVLVSFFSNIHHYISSSWYAEAEVPTWNYLAAQVCGTIRRLDAETLWSDLEGLTSHFEAHYADRPIILNDLPAHVKAQVNGIVGFEISIERAELAFKLSQSRSEADFANILFQLRQNGSATARAMADVMEKQRLG